MIGQDHIYKVRPPKDYRHLLYPDTMKVQTLVEKQDEEFDR